MTVLEPERHAIVPIHPYRESAAPQRVEPHPRHVQLSSMRRRIERGEDQIQTLHMPQPIWLRARMTLKGRRASCPRRLGRLDKQPYGQTAGALRERTSRARVQCCAASQAARAPGALTLVRRRQTRTTIARGGAALSSPSRPPPDWAKPPSQPPPELPELRRRRARRPPPARPRHLRCSAAADP